MSKLSEHFSRSEFACSCGCGGDTVDAKLINVLEYLRRHFHAPVTVSSGYRCDARNRAVGGSSGSQHKNGKAADIVVHGVPPHAVHKWLDTEYHDALGLGKYAGFTHVDVRDKKARWNG